MLEASGWIDQTAARAWPVAMPCRPHAGGHMGVSCGDSSTAPTALTPIAVIMER